MRSKLLARLNSRSRSLCRLVEGDDEDCSLFLFVNKEVDEGAPVNFRIGCGGELSLLVFRMPYVSGVSSFSTELRSSEKSPLFLEEAALVKDLMCRVAVG